MVTEDEFARLSNKVEDVATSVFMHHQVQVCVGVHACLRVVWCGVYMQYPLGELVFNAEANAQLSLSNFCGIKVIVE